jgi:hypothetical protein
VQQFARNSAGADAKVYGKYGEDKKTDRSLRPVYLRGSDFVSLRFRVDGYWISLLSS